MQREIVLDTETTGLDPRDGHRLIELGCIELVNRIPTGREFHAYVNPERDVPAEAERVHGLSTLFLADKPPFGAVVESFLAFLGADRIVIHNAAFDIGFLNAELARCGRAAILMDRVVDTLHLARRKHPAGPNTLDALCKRYGIDSSKRVKHGALLDCVLLGEVYIELLGVRQAHLSLAGVPSTPALAAIGAVAVRQRPSPLPPRLTTEDEARHRVFVATLGAGALWLRYLPPA